ncbi:MAG: DUF3500 domain-containing protein [Ilumatobacteraceae bacterium]
MPINARVATADRMAQAADAWLSSLDADERSVAQRPFPADDDRRRWFYTPTDHGGLALGAISPSRQRGAMRLLASGLSVAGYNTVSLIMGLENVLDADEGWRQLFDRERGRDPGMYQVRVFGDPVHGATWAWRFGGHHVSINHLVVDGEAVATTPCFLGADPATSALLGPHPLRPLGGVEDLGHELVRSLTPAQAARAIVAPAPPADLVGGNRPRLSDGDGPIPLSGLFRARFDDPMQTALARSQQRTEAALGLRPEHLEAVRFSTAPKGLPAADLTPVQREVLRRLLDTYVGRVADSIADHEAAKYAGEGIAALHFLWAGGTAAGEPHYYRIQGPRLVAEYDNAQRDANHAHSVWRDPLDDFGDDVLARHRARHHASDR